MKLLHTSDWHLGKIFYGYKFDEVFPKFIEWLKKIIDEENIEVLLIAGDIFQRTQPSNSTLKLYYESLTGLYKHGLKKIIIIGGNHDNPSTLSAPEAILKLISVEVIGKIDFMQDKQLIDSNKHLIAYPEKNPEVIFAAVPYPRERELKMHIQENDYESRKKALQEKIAQIYIQLLEKAQIYEGLPLIALGHFFIKKNYSTSTEYDYEDEAYVGSLTDVPADILPKEYDYWAMGHIHKPFKIIPNKIHYSGSPLPYGFPETTYKKKVFIIDTNYKPLKIKEITIPDFIEMKIFSGSFEEITAELDNFYPHSQNKTLIYLSVNEKKNIPFLEKNIEQTLEKVKKRWNEQIEILGYKYSIEELDIAIYRDTEQMKQATPKDIFKRLLEHYNMESEPYMSMFEEIYREVQQENIND